MKKLTILLSAAALVASAGAFAKDGLYVSGQLGAAKPGYEIKSPNIEVPGSDKTYMDGKGKANYTTDFAVGYNLGHLSFEGELGYFKPKSTTTAVGVYNDKGILVDVADVKSESKAVYSLMANTKYSVDVAGTPFKPYVGVGAGVVKLNNNYTSEKEKRAAYQGILGVSYELNEQVSLNTDYRHLATFEKYGKSSYNNDSVNVGVAYNF